MPKLERSIFSLHDPQVPAALRASAVGTTASGKNSKLNTRKTGNLHVCGDSLSGHILGAGPLSPYVDMAA